MPPSAVLATLTHIWPPLESTGIPVAIAGGIDLILHKLYSNRLIDQADVHHLLQTHGDQLDRSYLDHWSGQLEIAAPFRQAIAGMEKR